MSDSNATAREPSMEDILASIRRIIDEEDTRDARPAPDLSFESEADERDDDPAPMPVMAAATGDRDSEVLGGGSDSDASGDAIFPERESPFWSRATGRDEETTEAEAQAQAQAESDAGDATPEREGDASAAVAAMAQTDIFSRAQSKLESPARPSARERMQSLAARAEQHAQDTARDDIAETGGEAFDSATTNVERLYTGAEDRGDDIDTSNVLDLTDPVESAGDVADDALRAEADADAGYDAGANAAVGESDDDRIDAQAVYDADEESVIRDTHPDTDTDTVGRGFDTDAADESADILDLTMPVVHEPEPVEAGNVESGAEFQVSTVEPGAAQDAEPEADAIEDAISQNLAATGEEFPSFAPADAEAELDNAMDAEDGTVPMEIVVASETTRNTYSRFDRTDEDAVPGDADADQDEAVANLANLGPQDDAHDEELDGQGDDVAPTPFHASVEDTADSAAFFADADTTEHASTEDDAPAEDAYAADPFAGGERTDAAAHADGEGAGDGFTLHSDDAEEGESLGFSDTFGASDVYHDEPPELDEDYSRSFGVEDDPVAAHAAYAEATAPQDDMETVGGMVRDAMERDPVDYADPAALVSMTSEEISARALASLADVEGEASRRVYGALRISEDGESESLEGMVRGMLRPMLREWLDDNLPTMVETAVRGEVERISAKSRRYSRAADQD